MAALPVGLSMARKIEGLNLEAPGRERAADIRVTARVIPEAMEDPDSPLGRAVPACPAGEGASARHFDLKFGMSVSAHTPPQNLVQRRLTLFNDSDSNGFPEIRRNSRAGRGI
jgi:hypothetical protein